MFTADGRCRCPNPCLTLRGWHCPYHTQSYHASPRSHAPRRVTHHNHNHIEGELRRNRNMPTIIEANSCSHCSDSHRYHINSDDGVYTSATSPTPHFDVSNTNHSSRDASLNCSHRPASRERKRTAPETAVGLKVEFKAAADRLNSALTRVDEFLEKFIRSFKEDVPAPYQDRRANWRKKVVAWNRSFVLTPSGKKENEQQAHEPEKISFPELEQQLRDSLGILCSESLELLSQDDESFLQRLPVPEDLNAELEPPDPRYIDIQAQVKVSRAFVAIVKQYQHRLLNNVAQMSTDHMAAKKTLTNVKELRQIYRACMYCWEQRLQGTEAQ